VEDHDNSGTDGACSVCGYKVNGSGTKEDPYLIGTADDLKVFAETVNAAEDKAICVKLTADIDLAGAEWAPIVPGTTFDYNATSVADTIDASYSGTFDGDGHTISNFTIRKDSSEQTSGLFGAVSGTIKNLGIVNASFDNGGDYDGRFGALCGLLLTEGTIENCYVANSTVKTSSKIAGAICGGNYGGTIKNSFELGNTITGYSRIGHMVGDNRNDANALIGTVTNCYSDGKVVGDYSGTTSSIESSVTETDFASGRITYLLNGSKDDTDGTLTWKQTLTGGNKQDYPSFVGKPVVKVDETYKNPNHTVTFEMNGCGEAIDSQTVPDGGTATKPTAPTDSELIFMGWYTDEALTTPYDFTTEITADTTIYAKWQALGVKIVDGANVRIAEGTGDDGKIEEKLGGSGLRFQASVTYDDTLAGQTAAVPGILIYPADVAISDADLKAGTYAGNNVVYVDASKWQAESSVFTVALTNLAESNYNRTFVAKPYVKLDGTYYTDAQSVERSIYQVAAGLLTGETEVTSGLDVLNAYVNQVGIRLTASKDESGNATFTVSNVYTGEEFFTVDTAEVTADENGAYTIKLTASGQAQFKTFWKEYVRINNNNSEVQKMLDDGEITSDGKTITIKFTPSSN